MKSCQHSNCSYPVFGKGYCKTHQYLRSDLKGPEKKQTKIRPMSKKLAAQRKTYRDLREEFLSRPENMFCAVFPHLRSTEIHHRAGRGKNLNKVETWLAVSREGHQWAENHPKLAKERGFTMSRICMTDKLNEN